MVWTKEAAFQVYWHTTPFRQSPRRLRPYEATAMDVRKTSTWEPGVLKRSHAFVRFLVGMAELTSRTRKPAFFSTATIVLDAGRLASSRDLSGIRRHW